MKIRRLDENNRPLPPPEYDPKSKFFTLSIYYGGKFHIGDIHAYMGGYVTKYDYCELEMLNIEFMKTVAEKGGMNKPMRVFTNTITSGFRMIQDDDHLVSTCVEKMKTSREFKIYIEEERKFCPYVPDEAQRYEDSGEETEGTLEEDTDHGDEGSKKVAEDKYSGKRDATSDWTGEGSIRLGNEEDEIDGSIDDDSDEYNENFFEEGDDELDDELFTANVDFDIEWCRETNELEEAQEKCLAEDSTEENLFDSEDEFRKSQDGSDIENNKKRFPGFNYREQYDPTFELGMVFSTKKELRDAIHSYAIKIKRSINITRNDKIRVYAKCAAEDCEWKLHALKLSGESTYQIRKYVSEHKCAVCSKVKNLKSTWLSKRYLNKIRSDPKRDVKGFRIDVIEEIRCNVSKSQVYRAKAKAVEVVEGLAYDQYALLWDFANEVKKTNPGSTVVIHTDGATGENRFDRLYMCLYALKVGFLSGCRCFIGVDGCHLKGSHGGVLLSAVGVDPNNSNFPIAIAIVNNESCDTWGWFLSSLKLDLNITKDYEWTFMSDKQKGLIQAFSEVFPGADHRFCLRHLHGNFKTAGFRGEAFKNALWKCGTATTVNDFSSRMREMKEIDAHAADWFKDKPPMHWSRSHFSTISKCDTLLNNCCESFNSSILDAREKGILSMLEWLVEYFMTRMQVSRDRAEKNWEEMFCPRIDKLIKKNLAAVGDCIPIKADNLHYLVTCFDGKKYCVNLEEWTCACRKWDLSGIPCNHALSAILAQGFDYNKYVHNCYKLATYKQVYAPVVMPINGRSEWRPTEFIPPLPPNFGRPVGRPKRARRMERDEAAEIVKKKRKSKVKAIRNDHEMRRYQRIITCSICGVAGHNKKACSQNDAPRPVESEPSYEHPLSQLTQELISQQPSKLQVRRKMEFNVNTAEGNVPTKSNAYLGSSSGKNNDIFHSMAQPTAPILAPSPVAPPSMNEQFKQCQMPTNMVNIRAPAPFVGGTYIQSVETHTTRSCALSKQIECEGGQKFMAISSLNASGNEDEYAIATKKKKGKAPQK